MKHILFLLLFFQTEIQAQEIYLEPSDFVRQSFSNTPPPAKVIWLTKGLKKQIEDILSHKYKSLRVRYWFKEKRSVWILDEIGKTKPITAGIVIDEDKVAEIKVLVFRESRGWEIRHPFFTKQFIDITLDKDNKLTQNIDGISGATLSVRAITKLARIALLLNKNINKQS